MQAVIYVCDTKSLSVYSQFNRCAEYAKQNGYSISGKVLDFDGKHFHEAVNKVVADSNVTALMIYNKDLLFSDYEEEIFYRIYLNGLNKNLISVN